MAESDYLVLNSVVENNPDYNNGEEVSENNHAIRIDG